MVSNYSLLPSIALGIALLVTPSQNYSKGKDLQKEVPKCSEIQNYPLLKERLGKLNPHFLEGAYIQNPLGKKEGLALVVGSEELRFLEERDGSKEKGVLLISQRASNRKGVLRCEYGADLENEVSRLKESYIQSAVEDVSAQLEKAAKISFELRSAPVTRPYENGSIKMSFDGGFGLRYVMNFTNMGVPFDVERPEWRATSFLIYHAFRDGGASKAELFESAREGLSKEIKEKMKGIEQIVSVVCGMDTDNLLGEARASPQKRMILQFDSKAEKCEKVFR